MVMNNVYDDAKFDSVADWESVVRGDELTLPKYIKKTMEFSAREYFEFKGLDDDFVGCRCHSDGFEYYCGVHKYQYDKLVKMFGDKVGKNVNIYKHICHDGSVYDGSKYYVVEVRFNEKN